MLARRPIVVAISMVIFACGGDGGGGSESGGSPADTVVSPPSDPPPIVEEGPLKISTYIGGSGEDSVRDVAFDSAGNIYATGGSQELFPTSDGTSVDPGNNGANCGSHDAFLGKWNPSGSLVWSTVLGGAGYDRAYAIEVNATGVYIAGRAGDFFPTTQDVVQEQFAGDANQNSCYGPQDGFVAKFDHDGNLIWATYLGGSGRGFVRDIDVDSVGSIYVAMAEAGISPYVTNGAYDTSFNGGSDGVVLKLASDGRSVIWATYLGGSGRDLPSPSVRVHPTNGNVYITGSTDSIDYPVTVGAHQPMFAGGVSDIVLTGISPDGASVLFSTYLGGSKYEEQETHSLAVSETRIYVTGQTDSVDLMTSTGAFQETNTTTSAFVSSFEIGGNHLATTYLGGNGIEIGEGLSVAADGSVVITGATSSDDFPKTMSMYDSSEFDGFLTVLSENLDSVLFSMPIGGGTNDDFRAHAVSSTNLIAVGGTTLSSDFPVTNDSFHSSPGAGAIRGWDGLLGVIDIKGNQVMPPE